MYHVAQGKIGLLKDNDLYSVSLLSQYQIMFTGQCSCVTAAQSGLHNV